MSKETLESRALQAMQALVDLPDAIRSERLLALAGEDPALAEAVAELLGYLDRSDLLPPVALPASQETGERVGAWQLLRKIGAGGMGEVFLAERADGEYQMQVALKRIWGGYAPLALRFQRERQLLARLQHPHISQLIDGGSSARGHLWFAMEWVDGEPITQWCDKHRMGIEGRLRLLGQLCEAVAFAHRNLVVHRDIKPGNVLVDGSGKVRLLDFGIARLLEEGGSEATQTVAFTPAWAAPEQQAGAAVTTASDIYQLGLLLRHLLCGSCGNTAQAREIRMSTALAELARTAPADAADIARARGESSAHSLQKRLRGDLDAIVLRATAHAPEARYGTADELAEDLHRWATRRPLLGMRGQWRSRFWKFIQRNRASVILASVLGLGLVAATFWALERAQQARIQRDAAQTEVARMQAMRDYLQLMFRDSSQGGQDVEVRQMLQHSAGRLAEQFKADPLGGQSAALLLAEFYMNLGDHAAAEPLLTQMLEWPGGSQDVALKAQGHMRMALVKQMQGDVAAGFAQLRQSQALLAQAPQRHALMLNESRIVEARIQRAAGQAEASVNTLREAIAERQGTLARQDHDLAIARAELCNSLVQAGALAEAETLCDAAIALFDRLGMGDSVAALGARNALAVLYVKNGKLAEAEAQLRTLLQRREKLYGSHSSDYAILMLNLGSVQGKRGQLAEALALQTRAVGLLERHSGSDSPQTLAARIKQAETLNMMGERERAKAQLAEIDTTLKQRPALQQALGPALASAKATATKD